VRSLLGDIAVVVACFVMAGVPGLVLGVAAQVVIRRFGARVVAGGAVAALVVAAVATAVDTWDRDAPLFSFARDRAVAAEAGRAAGVLLLAALIAAARAERRAPAPDRKVNDGR
jgi:hypothetical protein